MIKRASIVFGLLLVVAAILLPASFSIFPSLLPDSALLASTSGITAQAAAVTNDLRIGPDSPYYDDFEGSIAYYWLRDTADTPYAATISSKYSMTGSDSLRVEARKDDPMVNYAKRSELTLLNNEDPAEEHTYSVAIYLPDGGDEDFADDPWGSEIITQWHQMNDPIDGNAYPPVALHRYMDHYELWCVWDDAVENNHPEYQAGHFTRYDLGPYAEDKGRWVQWTYKIKWGWEASQDPRITVYKDGIEILDVVGPNTYNNQIGNIFKIGINKWNWSQEGIYDASSVKRRVIYYDNVSID